MNLQRVSVFSLLLVLTTVGTAAAQAAPATIQVSPRVRVPLKPSFFALTKRAKGLTEIVRQQKGQEAAYLAVTTEKRSSHQEALARLQGIANERWADSNVVFTVICGW